mgnify:CR=1 FL=1
MIVRFTKTLTLVLALGVLVILVTSAFLAGAGSTARIRTEERATSPRESARRRSSPGNRL